MVRFASVVQCIPLSRYVTDPAANTGMSGVEKTFKKVPKSKDFAPDLDPNP
jgi:hypothetical protein